MQHPTSKEKEVERVAKTAAKVAAAATLAATRATAGLEGAPAAEPFPAAGGAAAEGGPTPMTTSKPAGTTTTTAGALHKNKGGLDVDKSAGWTGTQKLGKGMGGKEETGGPAATPPSTPLGGSGGELETETAAAPFASEAFYKGSPAAGIKSKLSGEGDVFAHETYHPGVAAKTRSPMEKEMTGALSPSTPAKTIPESMERPTFGTTATTTPAGTFGTLGSGTTGPTSMGGPTTASSSSVLPSLPLLSPTKAAEAINRGLEQAGQTTGSLAHKAVETFKQVVPSPASASDSVNVGLEKLEHAITEAEHFAESIINKAASSIRSFLPSPARGVDKANLGLEEMGNLASKAEHIAEDMAQHAIQAIRATLPSPAKGAAAANVTLERAGELATEAEQVAESMASRAVEAIRASLPSPATGLEQANKGVEQTEQLASMVTEKMSEKIKAALPESVQAQGRGGAAGGEGGLAEMAAAAVPSPAQVLESANKGLERALPELPKMPAAVTSPAAALETANKALETGGEKVAGLLPSVPAVPSVPVPAEMLGTANKGIETAGEKTRTMKERVAASLPSPASEAINKAPKKVPIEETTGGAGGAAGGIGGGIGGGVTGLAPATTMPMGGLGTVPEAAPVGVGTATQPHPPRGGLLGVLENMAEEFERGVALDEGQARGGRNRSVEESTTHTTTREGIHVVKRELRVETEGEAGDIEETVIVTEEASL